MIKPSFIVNIQHHYSRKLTIEVLKSLERAISSTFDEDLKVKMIFRKPNIRNEKTRLR